MPDTPTRKLLPNFGDAEVRKATVRITNAGDGLSEALSFDPVALELGDEVFFVLRGTVTQVNHKAEDVDDDGDVDQAVRVHTVKASEIAMVDESDVAELLERDRKRVAEAKQKAEDEAAGITRLPFDGDEDDETEVLSRQHAAGAHADGLRDGCPECDAEARSAASGE